MNRAATEPEPTCYSIQTSRLEPDGTTLVVLRYQAAIPWTGEIAYMEQAISLVTWSGLTPERRAAIHANMTMEVVRLYRLAWRAWQWESQRQRRTAP